MSNFQGIKTVVFDKNMNLIIRSDKTFETLFGEAKTLTQFNTFLSKNCMLDEQFSAKLKVSGKEYHICYKGIDKEETYEFHFFLLDDSWSIVSSAGRDDIYDNLTGLLTERSLVSLLSHEIKRSMRNKEISTAIEIDIAHLKDINEAFGFLAGDSIIKSVAKILDKNTRGSDVLGRYKGDKFVIILHKTDAQGAQKYLRKFEKALYAIKFTFEDLNFYLKVNYRTTSITQNDTSDDLLDRLRTSLYSSKEGAVSNIEYFTDKNDD